LVTYYPKTDLGGGYSGLASTAKQISEYIPKCKVYCEPFAGLGRVGKYVLSDVKIFNDKSTFCTNELRYIFPQSIVTEFDFMECIKKNDSSETFFLIDPPWRTPIYDTDKAYIDRTPKEYYQKIMEVLPKLKGDWFLCSSLAERGLNKILTKSGYPTLNIKSRRMICGKPATVKIISNKIFIRYHQEILN